jgi:hypothetical protein
MGAGSALLRYRRWALSPVARVTKPSGIQAVDP